ncbi:hypothetical protein T12_10131 [Trichinella patagoniensis]|uniref:Uncharacterized protein n=1 Tax=Trichinella patagoniensis TaxID=990121 RepID=A0A0V0ZJN8_9BILA|nr:hypothetical protein T12_7044 [Trichinella patagoniensis]KRY12878.1 hypothetical protein T12_10131 [Trichinella patagoniensis]
MKFFLCILAIAFYTVSAGVFDDMLRTETGKLCAEQCQQQYAAYQQAVQESMTRGYLHAEPASQDFVNCFVNCRVGLLGLR